MPRGTNPNEPTFAVQRWPLPDLFRVNRHHLMTLVFLFVGTLIVYHELPFLRFANTHEREAPIIRLAALRASLSGPEPTWRWQQELAQGFGEPLLNYYAPGFTFLSLIFNMAGLELAHAVLAAVFTALVAGLLGWYVLGVFLWLRFFERREGDCSVWFGPMAGALMVSVVMWAPYTRANVTIRLAAAEFLALSLLPWLLLAIVGLFSSARRVPLGWLIVGAVTYAGVTVSHNITALIASYGIALWFMFLGAAALIVPGEVRRRALWSIFGTGTALMFGLALSSAFWLPALTMSDLVYLDLTRTVGYFRVLTQFRPLWASWVPMPEWIHVGWSPILAVVALMMLGAARVVEGRRVSPGDSVSAASAAGTLRFFGGLFLVYNVVLWGLASVGLNRISYPVWYTIPYLTYVQFPWRLWAWLTVSNGILVALCGVLALRKFIALVPAADRERFIFNTFVTTIFGLFVMQTAFTFLMSNRFAETDLRMLTYDEMLESFAEDYITAVVLDEYRPRSAPSPRYDMRMPVKAPPYATLGGKVWLLDREADRYSEIPFERQNHIWRWEMPAAAGERLVAVGAYAMPGWRLDRDGEEVKGPDAWRAGTYGLVNVTIPPEGGEYTLRRRLLPEQRLANAVSIGAIALLSALLGWILLRGRTAGPQRTGSGG